MCQNMKIFFYILSVKSAALWFESLENSLVIISNIIYSTAPFIFNEFWNFDPLSSPIA